MQTSSDTASQLSLLAGIDDVMDSQAVHQLGYMLNNLAPADIAHHIESAPPRIRRILWSLVESESEGEVLGELREDMQQEILKGMGSEEMASLFEGLDTDDIADILQQLPDQIIPEVLQSMSTQDRLRVESVLTHNEDTAGGLMNTDTITVRPDMSLDVVLRYLRRHEEIPEVTDNLFVVNRKDIFLGTLPLSKVLTSNPNTTVREVMVTNVEAIPATMPDSEVAHLFERHDWVSAPVIDENNHLLGRITIDDVVDVIMEDADHSLLGLAGLSHEEETFASIRRTAPRRAIWLGVNLLTAIAASSVINMFEATIDKVVALAILMPIVASMGGVAGNQTLTVVIRGMALGHVGRSNLKWLLSKEFIVGCFNGLLWALVMGVIAAFWFDDATIAFIIAAAMVINLLTAAVAGASLPMILKYLDIDPALAGGVALTTVTDVVGFFSFLGLATLFYT
ncbi:MAG: magnesium transporter [Porticoccaceae bacterium]|nr:magnesium transporter [Pseudomonadales bacterium]MCP5172607.1 magnesium transporter [Pseudomonadales bacterium]MCP5303523.1 magnesium transporter [Pseudomonadales bacterium]